MTTLPTPTDQILAAYKAALTERRSTHRLRWVMSTGTLRDLADAEDVRRRELASEFYQPEPLPEDIDPSQVQVFGFPIRIDDEATTPHLEVDE